MSIRRLFGDDAEILRDSDFQLLLAANVLGALGTALVSPTLNSLTGPFGVSAADIGLFMSAFTAPAIVMIPLAGLLADRYGRKKVLIVGLLVFGAAGVTIAFTTEFITGVGLRALQGIGFAGITPVIITSIGDMYEGE